MKSVTTMRSRIGVMEIGQKSDGMSGTEIFASERIDADFHWLDTSYWQLEQQRTELRHVGTMLGFCPDRMQCGLGCRVGLF